jgi:uncharacterized protein YaiL (DUF2058 family)
MSIYDHPAYANHGGGKGPRTKKQRRFQREQASVAALKEKLEKIERNALWREAQEPTLHSVNWRP